MCAIITRNIGGLARLERDRELQTTPPESGSAIKNDILHVQNIEKFTENNWDNFVTDMRILKIYYIESKV